MMLSNGCSAMMDNNNNEISVRHGRRGGGTMLSFTHAAAFHGKKGMAWYGGGAKRDLSKTICLLRRHLDSEMHMSSERRG